MTVTNRYHRDFLRRFSAAASRGWTDHGLVGRLLRVRAPVCASMLLTIGACGGGSDAGPVGSASTTVTVVPASAKPTVSVTLSQPEIAGSGSATLAWTSTDATSCVASGAWTGTRSVSGSDTVRGEAGSRNEYTLSCTGPGGTASGTATLAVAAAATTAAGTSAAAMPFGLYVGNPNGNDASSMAWFHSQWDTSVQQLGRTPKFFGTFTDFSQDWDRWPSNAGWFAWSFNQSKRVAGMKPVIGIKLSTNAYWNRQADAFREIIDGKRDQVYRDVVTAWRDTGYSELRFRISYEFNGNFMPDNFGNTPEMLDLWRRAFARVADVMHAVPNVKVLVVWNPANINWAGNSVAEAYPGDRYVDVIASDIYSPLYPQSLRDWSGGPDAASVAEWAKNPVNRIHFWDYPAATQWTLTGSGWGMVQALDFALAHRKPFAISETGVGGDDNKIGPSDDGEFPGYLRKRLDGFVARGGTIDHVIIWDFDASDGKWRFSRVPGKAATAAAWKAFLQP